MSHFASPLLLLPNTYRAFYGTFTQLSSVQIEVIAPLLEGRDVILQAATGSGKTEAVLAPCVEQLICSQQKNKILYLIPTRALAMDLERRLAPTLARLELSLGLRTGDVKRTGGGNPDVLLTTPESLDVVLGSNNADMRSYTKQIRMVIIDEVHTFFETYRGKQLSFLLRRLECRINRPLQKIALSATIEDIEGVIRFFNFQPNTFRCCSLTQRNIIPHIVSLKNDERELVALLEDCYQTWGYQKILIFANNRGTCDRLLAILNQSGSFMGVTELHYSNLKSQARRGVEERFRKRTHALCIATSTLELGIDIGNVDGVLLYEPPESVMNFLQRIGRANRRQNNVHFWGICRGPQPERQLLRFLGLLKLAREGRIEHPSTKQLPSVLIQQSLSCLYEKKQLSLQSLQQLFPDQHSELPLIFSHMSKQGWIREKTVRGLFQGSWRYRDYYLERKIWSNFPETEEEYLLEMEKESLADLPKSVVKQLEVNDCVQLAGKRLQIIEIIEGEENKVLALPATQIGSKEIFWLGAGSRVSYEVAQAIQYFLESDLTKGEESEWGLFSRTRRLLEIEREQFKQTLPLANGMRLGRSLTGLYRYHTFIGAIGNMILQRILEGSPLAKQEDFSIAGDETGIECSHLVNFQGLPLPTSKKAFRNWAAPHLKILCALFPLNAFSTFLPLDVLLDEVTDFLYDARLATTFDQYLSASSEGVSGELGWLKIQEPQKDQTVVALKEKTAAAFLLEEEKQRWKTQEDRSFKWPDTFAYRPRSITGTLIGDYFRKQQCERWLSFCFLPTEQAPARSTPVDNELELLRMELGKQFEQNVLEHLKSDCDQMVTIEEYHSSGERMSLEERFQASLKYLRHCIQQIRQEPSQTFILSHAVMLLPSLLSVHPALRLDGVGIPDLIQLTMKENLPVLQIGDIKRSQTPQYSQKWQVGFYSFLMRELNARGVFSEPLQISSTGFLMTPSQESGSEAILHEFELAPFWASFPALWENIRNTLLQLPQKAPYRLEVPCTSCPWFDYCYHHSLGEQEILFLPGITAGILEKIRLQHLHSLTQVESYFSKEQTSDSIDDGLSPNQRERLMAKTKSLQTGQFYLREPVTRLFPANLSLSLFIQTLEDPLSRKSCGLGWCVTDNTGTVLQNQTWLFFDEEQSSHFRKTFIPQLIKVWDKGRSEGQTPHLFYFRESDWLSFQNIFVDSELSFLWNPQRQHSTSLSHLIFSHFDFPIPGEMTLYALSRVTGISLNQLPPESLFHQDSWSNGSIANDPDEKTRQAMEVTLKQRLQVLLAVWKWLSPHLRSEWNQQDSSPNLDPTRGLKDAYLNFIENEKRLREDDILQLQKLSFQERVERFRSLGPLEFEKMVLDEEGRFLYLFRIKGPNRSSKFREGDFLKLAPLSLSDLQKGIPVILENYDRSQNQICLRSRQGKINLNKNAGYSLEEDLTDWNTNKLFHGVQIVLSEDHNHPLFHLLSGGWSFKQDEDALTWAEQWLKRFSQISGLNETQQQALKQAFQYRLSLIEGPPGTGKTHLLGWILIALVLHAQQNNRPMRIVVSALTHQAIDQVLRKVLQLLNQHSLREFPAPCFKWGRWSEDSPQPFGDRTVQLLNDVNELAEHPYAILGATGFGLYQLFEGKDGDFPPVFDWVIFDEASQVLVPQALLSLLYGKGNFLFLGDVNQLPPIVIGRYDAEKEQVYLKDSILAHLMKHYDAPLQSRLNVTYRMNKELCEFPSQTWYEGALYPHLSNQNSRLKLSRFQLTDPYGPILNPAQPVSLVLLDHRGSGQKCVPEMELLVEFTKTLIMEYEVSPEQIAIITPHRAQNNAILEKLQPLMEEHHFQRPLIDTVERIQGAERDVILFGFTVSDLDQIEGEFLNNPNRFNVVITRAKKKLVVVGSSVFFYNIAHSEEALKSNLCFKKFMEHCQQKNSIHTLS
ncbi:DEAD/DEAH box helicase [Deltaproteobacteria bacterium TL4]